MFRCRGWAALWLILLLTITPSSYGKGRRQMQQAPCPVANCAAGCQAVVINGNSTAWKCTQCRSGYESMRAQRACVCRSGTFQAAVSCVSCTIGFYCSGGVRLQCPATLTTIARGARSISACVNPPGTRYVPHPTRPKAVPCPADSYSAGLQQQLACTPCPAGLKTDPDDDQLRASSSVCKAPPGYVMQSGAAVPCPVGSFSPGYTTSNDLLQCISCSDQLSQGLTTADLRSTDLSNCSVLLPGYAAVTASGMPLLLDQLLGNLQGIRAKLCPQAFFCTGGDIKDPASLPQACPTNSKTVAEGTASSTACLAPPGWKWQASPEAAVECEDGFYKEGWNRVTSCTPCGAPTGPATDPVWLSDRTMAVALYDSRTGRNTSRIFVRGSRESCYIRRGMGVVRRATTTSASPTEAMQALACPSGFFGVSAAKLYGLQVVMCTACPVNQVTACPPGNTACASVLSQVSQAYGSTVTYWDAVACMNPPGKGWINYLSAGAAYVMDCPPGSFSTGGHNQTCDACPSWMSTGADSTATSGNTAGSACVAPPGFTSASSDSAAQKCASGTFKATYGNVACSSCGAGGLWRSESTVSVSFFSPVTMQQTQEKAPAAESSCYLLPGMGTNDTSGSLAAVACDGASSYGAAVKTYGVADHPCSSCPDNMWTDCRSVTDAAALAACTAERASYTDPVSGGFTSALACKTLPGWGWNGTAAAKCSGRTWSSGGLRTACTPCRVSGDGFATPAVGDAFTSVVDCFRLNPGWAAYDRNGNFIFSAVAAGSLATSVAGAAKCPEGYICGGGDPTTTAPVPQPCGDFLTTMTAANDDGLGKSAATDCLAPPGFGCTPVDGVCSSAFACPDGTYKSSYGKGSCTPCGSPIPPAGTAVWHSSSPATSGLSCYLLPGLGISASTSAVEVCTSGRYGLAAVQRGLSPAACSSCPAGMDTACVAGVPTTQGCAADLALATDPGTGGFTSSVACRTLAGYGFSSGAASVCAAMTWSYGGHRRPCSPCPVSGPGFAATTDTGQGSPLFCYTLLAGYAAADSNGAAITAAVSQTDVSYIKSAVPCPADYWCEGGAPWAGGVPHACPTGVTTKSADNDTGTSKSLQADCKYNKAGYICVTGAQGPCTSATECATAAGYTQATTCP